MLHLYFFSKIKEYFYITAQHIVKFIIMRTLSYSMNLSNCRMKVHEVERHFYFGGGLKNCPNSMTQNLLILNCFPM